MGTTYRYGYNLSETIPSAVFEWDQNAVPVLFGRPERHFGLFKKTKLLVKLHLAYVIASEGLAR